MIDETGQVSEAIKKQTLDLLQFAAEKTGKDNKEMAAAFFGRTFDLTINTIKNSDIDWYSLQWHTQGGQAFSVWKQNTEPDLEKAFQCMTAEAQKGNAFAAYSLGSLYRARRGGAKWQAGFFRFFSWPPVIKYPLTPMQCINSAACIRMELEPNRI